MFEKPLILLVFVAGCVTLSDANICVCSVTTQKNAYNKADLVAKVRIERRNETAEWAIYNVTYEHVYKPKNSQNESRQLITKTVHTTCGGPTLVIGQSYLITAKTNDNHLETTTCDSFPQFVLGRPTGPIPWMAVDAYFRRRLDKEFKSVV